MPVNTLNIIKDILSGTPVAWLINQSLLPIYILFHWLVFHVPALSGVWPRLLLLLDPLFNYFLCVAKGFSLVNGIFTFKNHPTHSHLTQASFTGQLIVGILSSCGSTILYQWLIAAWNNIKMGKTVTKKTRQSKVSEAILFPHPGYDFYVSLWISIVIIVLSDSTLCRLTQESINVTLFDCMASKQDLSVISTVLILTSTMIKL